MHDKEDEMNKRLEEELKRNEDLIENIRRDFEMKENSHLEQLAIFEEEEHRLIEKIKEDK